MANFVTDYINYIGEDSILRTQFGILDKETGEHLLPLQNPEKYMNGEPIWRVKYDPNTGKPIIEAKGNIKAIVKNIPSNMKVGTSLNLRALITGGTAPYEVRWHFGEDEWHDDDEDFDYTFSTVGKTFIMAEVIDANGDFTFSNFIDIEISNPIVEFDVTPIVHYGYVGGTLEIPFTVSGGSSKTKIEVLRDGLPFPRGYVDSLRGLLIIPDVKYHEQGVYTVRYTDEGFSPADVHISRPVQLFVAESRARIRSTSMIPSADIDAGETFLYGVELEGGFPDQYAYTWFKNGQVMPEWEGQKELRLSFATPADAGDYFAMVGDPMWRVGSPPSSLTVTENEFTVELKPIIYSVKGARMTVEATITGGAAPLTYEWQTPTGVQSRNAEWKISIYENLNNGLNECTLKVTDAIGRVREGKFSVIRFDTWTPDVAGIGSGAINIVNGGSFKLWARGKGGGLPSVNLLERIGEDLVPSGIPYDGTGFNLENFTMADHGRVFWVKVTDPAVEPWWNYTSGFFTINMKENATIVSVPPEPEYTVHEYSNGDVIELECKVTDTDDYGSFYQWRLLSPGATNWAYLSDKPKLYWRYMRKDWDGAIVSCTYRNPKYNEGVVFNFKVKMKP